MNRRGLGRGLGALLSATPGADDVLIEIPVDQVEANPDQPRKSFSSEALEELIASIRASGVIQPVIVRRRGVGYQLIAGALLDRPDSSASRRSSATRPMPKASSLRSSRTCSAKT